jgi:solute carrier family 31 (copper transporter), member 1
MLFTWDTTNLCIVFRSWRITGTISLLFSLLAIIVLAAGYELVREFSRRYENKHNSMVGAFGNGEDGHEHDEHSSLLLVGGRRKENVEREGRIVKAAFYAVQVFYSFFIM